MVDVYRETVITGVDILDISHPIHAQIELTSNCNYHCPFCYNVWKEKGSTISTDMTYMQHITVANKISDFIQSVTFSGGEPTLIPWLTNLVAYYSKKNIYCSLITNGSNIDLHKASTLVQTGIRRVQVSIHHYIPGINQTMTGGKKTLELSLKGALAFLEVFGQENVNINMVVNSVTSNDVYNMGYFLNSKGFIKFSIGLQSVSGSGIENNKTPSLDNLITICRQLEALSKELRMKTGFLGGIPICAIPEDLDTNVHFYNSCDAAISQIVIGPDGNCRPCVEMPWHGGNILTNTIENIWKSQVFEDIRLFKNVPYECYNCRYVSNCHGGCRASAYNLTKSISGRSHLMPEKLPLKIYV